MTNAFRTVESCIASLRSGIVRTERPTHTLRDIPAPTMGDVDTMLNRSHPNMTQIDAMIRSVAVRFSVRTGGDAGSGSVLHHDLVEDITQSVWCVLAERRANNTLNVGNYPSFGLWLYLVSVGVAKNVVRALAKQDPNRYSGLGWTTQTPGTGDAAWNAYLTSGPAKIRQGSVQHELSLNEIRVRHSASVRDNTSRTDALIDADRNPNTVRESFELTDTEYAVLALIARGNSYQTVAEQTGLTYKSVQSILTRTKAKREGLAWV